MLHFLINPNIKKREKRLKKLKEKLDAEGVEYEFYFATGKDDLRERAGKLSEEPVKLIAVGGDGTLNDILCGMQPENVELGLLPFGTGNDFAASANVPEGIEALDLILHTEAKYTDYIECGGMRSINIAGLGIDVDILERCNRMKHGGKKGKYFRSLLASVLRYKGMEIEVTVNGETFTESAFIAVICNGKQFGGGIPICAPAVIDDRKLDLVVISSPRRWKLPVLLVRLMRGKILNEPIAKHILCESALIKQTGEYVQFDGELVALKVLDAKLVSGKLRMFRG